MHRVFFLVFCILVNAWCIKSEDGQPGPSNPVVKKLFGVESDGTVVLPVHKRMARGSYANSYNSYMVGCTTPNCQTVTYPNTGNTGCTNCVQPQTNNNGCNQPNCYQPQIQVQVQQQTCVWQYKCYTTNVCDNCGNYNQQKTCVWKCTSYCQYYSCG